MSPDAIEPYRRSVDLPVPAEVAWATLTDPDRVADWFARPSPLGPVGAPYTIEFDDESAVEGTIIEHDPGQGFAHTWRWSWDPPDAATLVRWRIEPLDRGRSRVTLIHEGWTEATGGAKGRDDHAGYWNGYLDDLADLVSGGT